ncbi:MAG: hypothetical protein MZW92_08015 [Comamonadaceae bacterium]|nr:hypothetical protein [Comamonadaceae bacterium]
MPRLRAARFRCGWPAAVPRPRLAARCADPLPDRQPGGTGPRPCWAGLAPG